MDHEGRLARLRERLAREGLDALYVSKLASVRYLCGFTGSSGSLLVTPARAVFFTDGRYASQSREEVEGVDVAVYGLPEELHEAIRQPVRQLGLARVGFEAAHVPVAARARLEAHFEGAELLPAEGIVEELRRVKDPDELALIRTAAGMADAGLAWILERVEPGRTERELALELEFHLRRSGADDVSFDPIVAAAERSALPHAAPTERAVEKGRFLLLDLGCVYRGYCSDLTRTVLIGPADARHREVYELVAEAQAAGIAAVHAGRPGAEVDAAARAVFSAAGEGDAFVHGLGHGVGIEIHEAPSLRATSADVLLPGDVVTVEPGVYREGWGGVRIEDLVVVTEEGCEVLSAAPRAVTVL